MSCSRRNAIKGMGGVALVALSGGGAAVSRIRRCAITNVRAYPSPFEEPVDNATVWIEGGRIARIQRDARPPDRRKFDVVDGEGGVLVAGFWNCHVHLVTPLLLRSTDATDDAIQNELQRAFTRWGFTTVVDLASTARVWRDIKRRIESRIVRGPRVLSAGDPFYPPNATPIYARPFYEQYGLPSGEVFSASEAAERAEAQLRSGADALKIFTGSILGGEKDVAYMPPEIVRAITIVGQRRRRPVFAHPTDQQGLEIAVRNGVQALAHSTPLMGRWTPEYASWIANNDVAMIPTLSLFAAASHPDTPVETAVDQARQLDRAGGKILFGTDAGFADTFDTAKEARLLASAIGWKGVLASLTTRAAELFGEGDRRGRVASGYAADLVLLRGDPASDVENLARVNMLLRNGEIIYRNPI